LLVARAAASIATNDAACLYNGTCLQTAIRNFEIAGATGTFTLNSSTGDRAGAYGVFNVRNDTDDMFEQVGRVNETDVVLNIPSIVWPDGRTGRTQAPPAYVAASSASADTDALPIILLASLLALCSIGGAIGWHQLHLLKATEKKALQLDLTGEGKKLQFDRRADFNRRFGRSPGTSHAIQELANLEVRAPMELSRTALKLQREIGRGEFGTVHRAMYTPSGPTIDHLTDHSLTTGRMSAMGITFSIPVAVKILTDHTTATSRENFAREAVISAQFIHVR